MQASPLEAALQAMCFIYTTDIRKTATYQRKHFHGKKNKALEFSLYELVNIATELAWFSAKRITYGRRRTDLASLVHEIRDLRNHVHPSKWARKHPKTLRINKAVYAAVFDVIDVANSWLLHRVEQSLLKSIKREGLA